MFGWVLDTPLELSIRRSIINKRLISSQYLHEDLWNVLSLYVNTENSQLSYKWQIKKIFDKINMDLNLTWMLSVYKPEKINRLALTQTYS